MNEKNKISLLFCSLLVITLFLISALSLSLISSLPNDANNRIDFTYPETINYSTIPTVNNSDYLDGYDSSYFYPASNPTGFITDGNTNWDNLYGFITNAVSDLTNYFTKAQYWTNATASFLGLTDQRYNETGLINSIGNWTNDKENYWNLSEDAYSSKRVDAYGGISTLSNQLVTDSSFDDTNEWDIDPTWQTLSGGILTGFGPGGTATMHTPFIVNANAKYLISVNITTFDTTGSELTISLCGDSKSDWGGVGYKEFVLECINTNELQIREGGSYTSITSITAQEGGNLEVIDLKAHGSWELGGGTFTGKIYYQDSEAIAPDAQTAGGLAGGFSYTTGKGDNSAGGNEIHNFGNGMGAGGTVDAGHFKIFGGNRSGASSSDSQFQIYNGSRSLTFWIDSQDGEAHSETGYVTFSPHFTDKEKTDAYEKVKSFAIKDDKNGKKEANKEQMSEFVTRDVQKKQWVNCSVDLSWCSWKGNCEEYCDLLIEDKKGIELASFSYENRFALQEAISRIEFLEAKIAEQDLLIKDLIKRLEKLEK